MDPNEYADDVQYAAWDAEANVAYLAGLVVKARNSADVTKLADALRAIGSIAQSAEDKVRALADVLPAR